MAVRTAGRVAGLAAGALVVALAVSGCGPDGGASAHSARTAGSASAAPSPGLPVPGAHALTAVPVTMATDGTTIVVGSPTATDTVEISEDPRCPICKKFEEASGPRLAALAEAGKVRIKYTLASFLDGNLGGGGSKRAVNALRASVDAGRFAAYHRLLYANQPDEQEDGFTNDFLLELAGRIDGLRRPAFDSAVKDDTYRDFVKRSEEAFVGSGATGTPTVKINGAKLSDGDTQKLFDASAFAVLLKEKGIG